MRRRIFGIVAAVALARLSFSGVVADCAPTTSAAMTHAQHVLSPSSLLAVHDQSADKSACNDVLGHTVCAAMSSCVSAVSTDRWTSSDLPPANESALPVAADRPLNMRTAPEPPPPRA